MKKFLSVALAFLMLAVMLPVTAMAETGANSAAEGQVRITKTLVSEQPDQDGNYTIKLTVQGNPVTQCKAKRGCGTGSRLFRLDEGYFLYLITPAWLQQKKPARLSRTRYSPQAVGIAWL